MKKTKLEKGITLIALIITVVILMILAAVTIGSMQDDGIVGKAEEARDKYKNAQEDEQGVLAGYLEELELASIPQENISNVTIGTAFAKTTKVTDEEGKTFVVPEGYMIVKDATTNNKVLVDEGVVIEDSKGNEWVWVPAKVSEISEVVNGKNVGKLYNFTSTGVEPIEYSSTGSREPDVVTNCDTVASNLEIVLEGEYAKNKTAASFKAQLQEEFDNMIESVTKYGGYYIGRYETGGSIASPVLIKGATVIKVETWYDMYASAKKLAANNKVTTGMIWGCQWDNTLRWLVSSGDMTWAELKDSSDWGNYNPDSSQTAGYSENWKAGNIYDLAGNLWDWTLEADDTNYRVGRGGAYNDGESSASAASYRYGNDPLAPYIYCFRPTLIIK